MRLTASWNGSSCWAKRGSETAGMHHWLLGGTECFALVDTGSSATLVKPEMVKKKTDIFPTIVKLQTVTGERTPMVGETLVTLGLGRRSARCPVWVANLEDCILGLDVLGALDCVISTRRGTLTFPDGHTIQMHRRPPQPGCLVAHNITTETLPAPSPSPTTAGVHLRSAPATQPEGEEKTLAVREVWQNNCEGLTHNEQSRLLQLLLEFKDCFSLSENDVGRTDLIEHDIDTGEARPIRMRPRRLPLARQVAADKTLRELQQAGLIEPSSSSWASQ